MAQNINEPTEVIAAAHKRWKRNRQILQGEEAVKAACVRSAGVKTYLSKFKTQSDDEYADYVERVPFFPGASRTAEGLLGLVFRKDSHFEAPAVIEPVMDAITVDNERHDDLAEILFSETLTTAFTGMLIDHPAPVEGLTMANAIGTGFYPKIALYKGESILEVTAGPVGNLRKLVRVRLLDDEKTVRELVLIDGVYNVIVHHEIDGVWVPEAPIVPLRNGAPLNDIPFVLTATKARAVDPCKAPLDDICSLNVHHFRASAKTEQALHFIAHPLPVFSNVGDTTPEIDITPGNYLMFSADAKVTTLEHSGNGVGSLENNTANLEKQMASVGSRILASEKVAAEAAETLAIRRASENATLAAIARLVSRKLEEALTWVAYWMGAEEPVLYELNTDFLPAQLDAQKLGVLLQALQAGAISHETFINKLVAEEELPQTLTYEEEKKRLDSEASNIDRPVAQQQGNNPTA